MQENYGEYKLHTVSCKNKSKIIGSLNPLLIKMLHSLKSCIKGFKHRPVLRYI